LVSTISFSGLERMDYSLHGNNVLKDHSWPSFWAPIAKENITETRDTTFGVTRTAVSCTECDAHLGHVFDDGPKPTYLRYCMNSVSLRFVKRA
jgi:peptide-methionine (R)-S-oxide reductase